MANQNQRTVIKNKELLMTAKILKEIKQVIQGKKG